MRRISLIEVSAWEKRGWVRVNVWVGEKRHSIHFIHHCCAHLTVWVTLFAFYVQTNRRAEPEPGGSLAVRMRWQQGGS